MASVIGKPQRACTAHPWPRVRRAASGGRPRPLHAPRPAVAEAADGRAVGIPAWAQDSVWYQIHPLGFCGSELANDGTGPVQDTLVPALEPWYNHLAELGVGVVLFNPVFESDTHGYDTADYKAMDRRLGAPDAMRAVINDLHAKGIRVVLDGVFNHTGRRHPAFLDCLEKGTGSEYANWYHLGGDAPRDDDSIGYRAWEGHANLPVLNLMGEPAARAHIFDVAAHWLGDVGADGWRLDVAHEVSPDFWREFAGVCREASPDAVLIGELIHGDYSQWISPGCLHGGTNYQLSKALWSCLNDANYFELAHSLQRQEDMYRGLPLLNFLGNHDTTRLVTRLNRPNEHFPLAQASLLLGIGGMPCLYYGDEIGLEGRGTKEGGAPYDADLRPVPPPPGTWDADQQRKAACVRSMLQLRRSVPALAHGRVAVAGVANGQLALMRLGDSNEGGAALLVFNCTDEETQGLPHYVHVDGGEQQGTRFRIALAFEGGFHVEDVSNRGEVWIEGGKLQGDTRLAPHSVYVCLSDGP